MPTAIPGPVPDRPALLTFDIFGTVVDWRRGFEEALGAAGCTLGPGDFDRRFDRIIDAQAALEAAGVFVGRPHARPGRADLAVGDLLELAGIVEGSHGR